MGTGTGGWFRRFHPAGEGAPRLLCFPYAGGSAGAYHALSAALGPAVEVTVTQYPGRQDRRREPVVVDLCELADRIAAEAAALPTTAFFGHSMGAIVAFEVARRLETPPPVLIVSGRRAPSRSRQEGAHPMGDRELLDEMARLGGTDARLLDSPAFVRMILPVARGDYQAIDTYRYEPGPPLDCPIVVLAGDADPLTPVEDALAWREHGTRGGDAFVFPGGHFFLDDHLERVAEIIRTHVRTGDRAAPEGS
ncbi:thioesterase II family protein [Actinomadura kijaniata]|uniref:thioesterase II family protein n=1 Tax=Actinomadura kijaniata TaxID=46161 RepID=UPI003F19F341